MSCSGCRDPGRVGLITPEEISERLMAVRPSDIILNSLSLGKYLMINDHVIPEATASPPFLSSVSVPVLISQVFRALFQLPEGGGQQFVTNVSARVLISVANP